MKRELENVKKYPFTAISWRMPTHEGWTMKNTGSLNSPCPFSPLGEAVLPLLFPTGNSKTFRPLLQP
jgi:hypothetical protein